MLITDPNEVIKKTILITLMMLIVLPLSTSVLEAVGHSVMAHGIQPTLKDPHSEVPKVIHYPKPTHKPIYIVGDANFTEENGVIGGDGTKENPYIIANWIIKANMTVMLDNQQFNTGIYIANTTKYFIIRNVTIYGGGFGILLINVTNFKVSNTTISHCNFGVLVEGEDGVIENNTIYNIENVTNLNVICGICPIANNTIVRRNKIENVTGSPNSYTVGIIIYAPDYLVYNVTVEDNVIKNIYHPVFGEGIWVGTAGNGVLRNIRVAGNIVEGITDNSILVSNEWGGTSNNITVANNIIRNATNRGILLYHVNGNVDVVNNSISCISVIAGIGVEHSTGRFIVQNNTIANTTSNGIHILNTSNVKILGNLVDSNADVGTGVKIEHSNSITIENNNISNMGWNGIETTNSNLITIEGNTLSNISGSSSVEGEGMHLANTTSIIIKGNHLQNISSDGIGVLKSSNVSVDSNTLDEVKYYGVHAFKATGINSINNTVINAGGGIFFYNVSRGVILGNIVENTTGEWPAIKVDANSSDILIKGNHLQNISSDGIGVLKSSNVSVDSNTLDEVRWAGICVLGSTDMLVKNNSISGTGGSALVIAGYFVNNNGEWVLTNISRNVFVENNVFSGGYHPIDLVYIGDHSSNVTLIHNVILDSGWSGVAIYKSSSVTVKESTIRNAGHSGLFIHNSTKVLVEGNSVGNVRWACIDLTGNTNNSDITVVKNDLSDARSGVWIGSGNSGVEVHFNNIVNVSEWGVYNDLGNDVVNASLNWWGDVSGPSGEGLGSGAPVSSNVIYKPWLNAPYPGGRAISGSGAKASATLSGSEMVVVVNATREADTVVFANGSGSIEVSVIKYSTNPVSSAPPKAFKFIDVHINDSSAPSAIKVRTYYKVGELNELPETGITPYWWDGNRWVKCSNYLVNTTSQNGYSGYVEITITGKTKPSLANLVGTPLSLGAPPQAPPVVGGVIETYSPSRNEIPITAIITTIAAALIVLGTITLKKKWSS